MRTYIFTTTDSPVRGLDVRVTVYRIKNNQPHMIGHSDSQTASWPGDRGEAQNIINRVDRIPFVRSGSGSKSLRRLIGFADMYDTSRCDPNGVRIFSVCGACQD